MTEQKNFYSIKNNPNDFIVSIHIRRRDVDSENKWKRRYTNDEVYLEFIKKIYKIKPNAKIHIFSQKEGFENSEFYDEYKKLNCIFNLVPYKNKVNDNTMVDTFNTFIMSDILLLASSSFSIVPSFFKRWINCLSK